MTENVGKLLPLSIASDLSIQKRARSNTVIFLLTTDVSGFSRVCLLSPYQVISTSRSELCFQVYKGSHTEHNLNKKSNATFILQDGLGLLYVRGFAKRFKSKADHFKVNTARSKQSMYRFKVTEVLGDRSEAAPINSHMKFDATIVGPEYRTSFEDMRSEINSALSKFRTRINT